MINSSEDSILANYHILYEIMDVYSQTERIIDRNRLFSCSGEHFELIYFIMPLLAKEVIKNHDF
jgi:hypothetical protein